MTLKDYRVLAQDGTRALLQTERDACWRALFMLLDDADIAFRVKADERQWLDAFDALVALRADDDRAFSRHRGLRRSLDEALNMGDGSYRP